MVLTIIVLFKFTKDKWKGVTGCTKPIKAYTYNSLCYGKI